MGTTPSPGVDDRAADQPYPLIRRPITVGGLHLPNRIVMSPKTYGLADPDGASTTATAPTTTDGRPVASAW